MAPQIKGRKIALAGAGGQLGTPTVNALLSKGVHTITAIQREESNSTFPLEVIVKKGSLDDESFLVETLKGQDVVVLMVPLDKMDAGKAFIRAAAKAGVPYILPTEFGPDPLSKLRDEHSMMIEKREYRELIDQVGGSSWIAVSVSLWLDANVKSGLFGIDVKGRKASLWKGANAKITTTTVRRTGEGIAVLLSLPEAELARYKNKPYYFASFELSQQEIFDAVKRVTGTTDVDWDISTPDADQVLKENEEKIQQGDPFAAWIRFFVLNFKGGYGGNFHDKIVNLQEYGVPQENLDEVVKEAIAGI